MIGKALWRVAITAAVFGALAAGYLLWFRDSSLVAVQTVKVAGIARDADRGAQIREALVEAGRRMTTLNVDRDRLRAAVADFPEVGSVAASASFPSTLEVTVELRRPVARIGSGEEAVGVAGDGTVLPPGSGSGVDIPTMDLIEPPDGGSVQGAELSQVGVMAAAPPEMLAAAESTSHREETGVVITLKGGIELRFGDESRASEKWRAAVAVLGDPDLQRLDYIDLTSPSRPAVGGQGHELPPVP